MHTNISTAYITFPLKRLFHPLQTQTQLYDIHLNLDLITYTSTLTSTSSLTSRHLPRLEARMVRRQRSTGAVHLPGLP